MAAASELERYLKQYINDNHDDDDDDDDSIKIAGQKFNFT